MARGALPAGYVPGDNEHVEELVRLADQCNGAVMRVGTLVAEKRAGEALEVLREGIELARQADPATYYTGRCDEDSILEVLRGIGARNAPFDAERYQCTAEGRRLVANVRRDLWRAGEWNPPTE
jgi:hypothetical protein